MAPVTLHRLPRHCPFSHSTPSTPIRIRSLVFALVAAPALLSASPAQATLTETFTGFTGVFAPSNWSGSTTGTGTTTFNPGGDPSTTMRFTVNGSTASSGAQYTFNTSQLATLLTPPIDYRYDRGEFSFSWSWDFASGTNGSGNPFTYFSGTSIGTDLWTYNGTTLTDLGTPSEYTRSGTVNSVNVTSGNVFGFRLNTIGSSSLYGLAEGTITNFAFTAYYERVPAPLPVAGAAAAFAWSRKLRRRLKMSQPTSS